MDLKEVLRNFEDAVEDLQHRLRDLKKEDDEYQALEGLLRKTQDKLCGRHEELFDEALRQTLLFLKSEEFDRQRKKRERE